MKKLLLTAAFLASMASVGHTIVTDDDMRAIFDARAEHHGVTINANDPFWLILETVELDGSQNGAPQALRNLRLECHTIVDFRDRIVQIGAGQFDHITLNMAATWPELEAQMREIMFAADEADMQ
ncbi:MAG: hypothetical protein GY915_05850 [bacterium]|nr:hypothetical protein [bacterium]